MMSKYAPWASGLGASLAAILASACCIGPVILAALGAGSAGSASALSPYRPYFLGLTAILLGFAFWRVYRPQKEQDCCDVSAESNHGSERIRKGFLWSVTAVVLVSAGFPSLQAGLLPSDDETALSSAAHATVLEVHGMTCVGCENYVAAELEQLPGVVRAEVQYETGEASVYTLESTTNTDEFLRAVERAGYSANLKKRN